MMERPPSLDQLALVAMIQVSVASGFGVRNQCGEAEA